MKLEEQRKQKVDEAIEILKKFGMPSGQQNERTVKVYKSNSSS